MADLDRMPDQVRTLRTTHVLTEMLCTRGFTSVRDCGGATKFIADAIDEGLILGPRLFQCGKALSQTGGHADFSVGISGGNGDACCGGQNSVFGRTVDGVPACLKAVREELKQGANFIKIMAGGGCASETDGLDTVQLSSEEMRAITSAAWAMGKKTVGTHTRYLCDLTDSAPPTPIR